MSAPGAIIKDAPLNLPQHIYYLQPLEIVAMGIAMGEKRWKKCEEEARRLNISKHSRAVAYGADVRVTMRREHDMRPPPEWLAEAMINEDTLRRARELVFDE